MNKDVLRERERIKITETRRYRERESAEKIAEKSSKDRIEPTSLPQ